MSTEQLYAVNQTDTNLVLKAGYLVISRGGFAPITEDDKTLPDVKHAYSQKWLKYSNTEPTAAEIPEVPAIEFAPANEGLTAEELLKSIEAEKTKEPESKATVEALGNTETTTGTPTVERIGAPTPESEAEPETAEQPVVQESEPKTRKSSTKKAE